MHNAFLNIDHKKMSKSEGNFFTVREISEKYELQVIRFFMLSAHYRSPLNFSADLVEASKKGLERILTLVETLNHLLENAKESVMTAEEKELFILSEGFVEKYEAAMEDDFNTADAIAALFELVKFVNINTSGENTKEYLQACKDRILTLCDILGIIADKEKDSLDVEIEALIQERSAAKKAKDFAHADAIRNQLLEMGIELKDTREGVQWKRI